MELLESEKIILETTPIIEKSTYKLYIIIGYIFTSIGFLVIIIYVLPSIFIFGLEYLILNLILSIIFIILILSGILLVKSYKVLNRIIYYITTKRIVEFIDGTLLHKNPKQNEISLEDASYIINYYDSIEIVTKNPFGESNYNGTEMNQKRKPKKVKSIIILLEGLKGEELQDRIKNLLINRLNLVEHPNIRYLFYKAEQ